MRRQHPLTCMLRSLAATAALAGTITLVTATTSAPAHAQTRAPAAVAAAGHPAAPENCPVAAPRPARPHAATATPEAVVHICPGEKPPCYGRTCVGKDPYITGCYEDGQELKTLTAAGGGGTTALYYSDWCAANWATMDVTYWPYYVQTLDGQQETGGSYTLMVDGTQLAKACLPAYDGSKFDQWHCTAWY